MNRRMRMRSVSLGAVVLCLVAFGGRAADYFAEDPKESPISPTKMAPSTVMGNQACLECHKAMIEQWQTTKHATFFEKLRQNPDAKTYATNLGIAVADITGNSVCATCHGMRADATSVKTISGVGCESCHGPAGGKKSWLNPHGSYGSKETTRETETAAHRTERFETCDRAGMVRPERVYLLARNCMQCHLMYQHGDVVNKSGGHPAGSSSFELVSWTHGEIDHNLFIDPKKNPMAPSLWMWRYKKTVADRNRVMYVAGKLAGLEIALRNLAEATKETAFSQAMAGHARGYNSDLSDINGSVTLPEIDKVQKEFRKIRFKLRANQKAVLLPYVDLVYKTGINFVRTNDGSKLNGLDQNQLIPTDLIGTHYVPK